MLRNCGYIQRASQLENGQYRIREPFTDQEQLGQKILMMTFTTNVTTDAISERLVRFQELHLQIQRLLVGQSVYTVDKLAVQHAFSNNTGKPKGHWITLEEILSLDDANKLSSDGRQHFRQFCQKWISAGWSLDKLVIGGNMLRELRRDPAHQLSQLDSTSADDLLSFVPACCQSMGRLWDYPSAVSDIQGLISTLRDDFTSSTAVLYVP